MEYQVLFNWALGLVAALFLLIIKLHRDELLELRRKQHELTNMLHGAMLSAAQEYASQREIRELRGELRELAEKLSNRFRELFERLDKKVDK